MFVRCSSFLLVRRLFRYFRHGFLLRFEKTFTEQHNQSLSIPLESGGFSAVTMWFVIEHFQDLNSVLQKVSDLLIGGGIFAFFHACVVGRYRSVEPPSLFCAKPDRPLYHLG